MDDKKATEIGAEVRRLRKELYLTQEALGLKAKVPTNTIARLERGEHYPTTPTIKSLAKALDVKASYLIDL